MSKEKKLSSTNNFDLNIALVDKRDFSKTVILDKDNFVGPLSSHLILKISGLDNSDILLNTIRRITLDNIPTYAISDESITIEENTSIFNNDYMKLRLSQLPIFDINTNIIYLEPKFWKDVKYSIPTREKNSNDVKHLEMNVNVKNNTNSVLNVTTEHIEFYEDGELKNDMYLKTDPILLIQLRQNEKFICHMRGVLGVGERNNIWAACSNTFYDYDYEKNTGLITLESQGQLDEFEILIKVCKHITFKLSEIESNILKQFNTDDIKNSNTLNITLDGENHTLGNMINDILQNNQAVSFSGVSKPDYFVNQVVIKYHCTTKNPLIPFSESIKYITSLFSHIESKIRSIGKEFITTK